MIQPTNALNYEGQEVVLNLNHVPEGLRSMLTEKGFNSGRSYRVSRAYRTPKQAGLFEIQFGMETILVRSNWFDARN